MTTVLSTNLESNENYEGFLEAVRTNFDSSSTKPLFTTNSNGLWEAFISNIPEHARQHYTCNSCKQFVEKYGGLVYINEAGQKESAIWPDEMPIFFASSVVAMVKIILKSKINGVFLSEEKMYGRPVTCEWHHISVKPTVVWSSLVQSADQKMAEELEDFKMLVSALQKYTVPEVDQALKLLRSDSLYRSEKVLGVAEWLKELHTKRASTKSSEIHRNLIWLAVATAPAGFCHISSSMIGTLLDDLVDGLTFENVSARFAAKMNPLQYQRPQAAPSVGNIAQAEKIVEKLGIARSLERRFARVDELKTLWDPKRKELLQPKDGVFSHISTKNSTPVTTDVKAPPVTMTWDKFSKTILPDAISIKFFPPRYVRESYSAIVTAAHNDAPPILQWDNELVRNPFSTYVYHGGSSPSEWNILTTSVTVTAVCLAPSMWQSGFEHHVKTVYFILEGAKDTRYKNSGNAIFPELLKSELHSIRSTVEAYSKNAVLSGYDEASACGISKSAGKDDWSLLLEVTSDLGVMLYKLDRWD